MNWAPLRTVRHQGWKFIDAPRPELYDLARDPAEARNLAESRARRMQTLRDALTSLTGGSVGAMRAGGMDAEARAKLAALGYIAAAGESAPPASAEPRADPKDMIGIFNRLRRANHAVRDRQFAEALPILQDILHANPRNAFAHLVLGSAYLGMERYRPAIEQYRTYLELVPTSAYAHQWMAICHVRLGQEAEALR